MDEDSRPILREGISGVRRDRGVGRRRGPMSPSGTPDLATTLAFEELDLITRLIMISEFEAERDVTCSSSCEALSPLGATAFPFLMRAVMTSGNEASLARALALPQYWQSEVNLWRSMDRGVPLDFREAAVTCALSEFNFWYVRGLAKRLVSEGVALCEVCSTASVPCRTEACALHDGEVFRTEDVYHGSRLRLQGGRHECVVTIPAGDGCYHTIRRKRAQS